MSLPSEHSTPRPFVGRERELRDLLDGLDDACAARGRLMLLVGEPGIGKTRTADELALQARRRGAQVFVGRCYEGEGAPPYWPWVEVMRAYARATDPAVLRADLGGGGGEIAQVIDELRQRLPDLPAPPVLAAEQARFRFFDCLTRCVKNAARRQPLVLILDDLHRADPPSLLLLQSIAREIADTPLLLVGTYRDVEVDRRHPLVDALGELARQPVSRVVALRGLSESEVGRFMTGVGASAPPAPMVSAVHQRTEGNPFFVGELVRLLAPDGAWVQNASFAESAMPRGVQEVLAARLDGLSPPCRELLQVAAVSGREFDLRVVADAIGRVRGLEGSQGDSASHAARVEPFLEPLEEALRQRLVTEVPGRVFAYSFSHALIRDALYAELTPGRRIRLHRSIGEALEAPPGAASDMRWAELAHHFCATLPGGGDAAKAVAYARRAAEHARTRLAFEESARCYELALRALARDGTDRRQQCELLLALGDAHHLASNEPAARGAHARCADLARSLGDGELLARAALGFAGVIIGVQVDEAVLALLEEALAALPVEHAALRAIVLARLAMELYFSPDAERRAAVSAEAVATARASGDQRALIRALEARHFVVWHRIGPAARLALADEMIRLSAEIDDAEILMRGQHLRLADLLELGRIVEVDDTIAAYARLAEELRPPSHRWGLGLCRAMRSLMNGHFDEAEALAAAALAVGQSVQPETAANFYAAQIFSIRREQGRLAELEDALLGAVAAFPAVSAWRSALACLYCEVGRRDDAGREFERAASADFADIAEDGTWLTAVALSGEVCAHLADRRRAAGLYDRLLPYRELVGVAGVGAVCMGSVARVLGLLAGTLGRWDDAIRHFDHALGVNRSLGAPPLVLRTQQDYAAMLLAAAGAGLDTAERARALLDEAAAGARALGMGGVAARVDALRGGLRPAAPPVLPAAPLPSPAEAAVPAHIDVDATDNLFRRDDAYWTLAFEGRRCRLKDAKGLRYLAILLQEPNRGFHVSELVRDEVPAASDAVGGYRARLRDLSDELEEAERFNDSGRAARVQAEIDALTAELSRLVRVGQEGHELLRLRVTKAIKAAARKVSAGHPALGHHLRTSIRTGSVCTYAPDPTKPVRWSVRT